VNLLRLTVPPEPAWEPDHGWRVLDADGHVVNAGPRILLEATFDLARMFGLDETQVPVPGAGREQ